MITEIKDKGLSRYLLSVPQEMMNSLRKISQQEQKTIKQIIREALEKMIKGKLK